MRGAGGECAGHDTVLSMPTPSAWSERQQKIAASTPPRGRLRRAERWLWTGPAGHLLGGTLDFAQALTRYWRRRIRR
jgi:hypothetical protein